MFKEALQAQAGPGVSADEQHFLHNFWASLSFGGVALMGIGLIGALKNEFRKGWKAFIKSMGTLPFTEFIILKSSPRIIASTLVKVVGIYAKKAFCQEIVPCAKFIKKPGIDRILKAKAFVARSMNKSIAAIGKTGRRMMKSVRRTVRKFFPKVKKSIAKVHVKLKRKLKSVVKPFRKTNSKIRAKAKKATSKLKRTIKHIFKRGKPR